MAATKTRARATHQAINKSKRIKKNQDSHEYRDIFKDFLTSPTVKYVAGGIAAAILARIAINISDRYPELSEFLKENLDTVEGKLGEFKSTIAESTHH